MNRPACAVLLVLAACTAEADAPPESPLATEIASVHGVDRLEPRLSPDGRRLASTRSVEGRLAIYVSNVDGTDPVRLTHGVWDNYPVWSPDGRWIAYNGLDPDVDLFIVPSDGGDARQLTSGDGSDLPLSWLPDGSGVVFTRSAAGPLQTLVVPIDGGPPQPLVAPQAGNQLVVLSPDGTRAAIQLSRAGSSTIWVQDMDGGEARPLTTEGFEVFGTGSLAWRQYVWSPDGRFIAYESQRTGTKDIWVADVETGELRQVTTDIYLDAVPRWSPDGRWIAFQSERGGQRDIWIVPAAGGAVRRVTNDAAAESHQTWSPDGTRLYYESRTVGSVLQLLSLDGSSSHDVAAVPGYQIDLGSVSPDGATAVFMSDRSGDWDLWSVPLAGGDPVPFATGPGDDILPQYSPDGGTVVFRSARAGTPDLWLMPAAGGDARPLTDWPSVESSPHWSPDGRSIAFRSNRDSDQLELWVMSAGGGEGRRLTTALGDISVPVWSPDGSMLFFAGVSPAGGDDLYRVPVSGGEPVPLHANPLIARGDEIAISPDGSHVAYAVRTEGWSFIEVIPTAGGEPRRLTIRTEDVYHGDVRWSADGTSIIVSSWDMAENSYDIELVTWPAGEWRRLTSTPEVNEFPSALTPDGRHALINQLTMNHRILSVPMMELTAETASR